MRFLKPWCKSYELGTQHDWHPLLLVNLPRTLNDRLTGQQISLSYFRGKQAVILVFIYGDTRPVCHGPLAQLRDQLKKYLAVERPLLPSTRTSPIRLNLL
jgi:hypothetical protein